MNIESTSPAIESDSTSDESVSADDVHRRTSNVHISTNNAQDSGNSAADSGNNGQTQTKKGSKRLSPEPLNRVLLQGLDLNEVIAQAAGRSEYVAALTQAGIPAAETSAFLTENNRCRTLLTQSLQSRNQGKTMTRTESDQEIELRKLMRKAQAAALQQYDSDPTLRPRLVSFGIGIDFQRSHARLSQYSASVLHCLQTDPLPGLAVHFPQALSETRDAWLATNDAQAAAKQSAMARLQESKTLAETLTGVRLRIQFMIDGAFPYDEVESAPVRAAFHLPLTRPFRAPARR